jgi:V/A-type H+-transporting ATPase subunit E
MALETIVTAIAAEADAEVRRITEEASRRVEAILIEARARADEEQAHWAESRAEEASQAVDGIVNRARLDSDRKVADAREALFQEALDRLADRIDDAVNGSEYQGIFRALHAEATTVVPDPDATILVRPADVELAERVAQGRNVRGAVNGVLDCIGGLDIESEEGRTVRNTIDSRLLQAERRLRRLAVQVIPEMASAESQA